MAPSGYHDRRIYDPVLKLLLVLVFLSFVMTIFYSWKIGLAATMYFVIQFITWEAASAPPANRVETFLRWNRTQTRARPVLLCLGDSLTHGTLSASYTPRIPTRLCSALGMDNPSKAQHYPVFADPVWVVNAGQNNITSYTILHERLNRAMTCYPDYILLMIGSNDVLAMYSSVFRAFLVPGNGLPVCPTMKTLEYNIQEIIRVIRDCSPLVRLAVCTLPPIGENLKSKANQMVREANAIIEKAVAADEKTVLIPVYSTFEAILEKKGGFHLPVSLSLPAAMMLNPWYQATGVLSWNVLSMLTMSEFLFDGLHFNEKAADLFTGLVVEWLMKANIAKSIAVKQ